MKVVFSLTFLLIICGCSIYGSINKNEHKFTAQPQKIVWLHLPGLDEEHISLLKFFYKDSSFKTSFEQATCFGKIWRYNLYEIRPTAESSFLSQAMGTKNVKGGCDDYDFRPIWTYLSEQGFRSGVLESSKGEGLLKARRCGKDNFFTGVTHFSMSEAKGTSDLFHAQEIKTSYSMGKTYYDKSCQSGTCYNSVFTNMRSIIEDFLVKRTNFLLVVKDDQLLQNLKTKKLKSFKQTLLELEKMFEYLIEMQKTYSDLLVIVTSAEPIPTELPRKGKGWGSFIAGKNNLIYKRSSVVSPLWSKGPRAENFCGMYEEAEVLQRTMKNFTDKRLEILGLPIM